jgi:hypothetical protein
MKQLITFPVVVILFVLVRSADLAISAAIARDIARAICYAIVAILALLAAIVLLFGGL